MRRLYALVPAAIALVLVGCVATVSRVDHMLDGLDERRIEAEQYYSFGASYYAQRNYDEALVNWQKSLEVDSSYYDPYIGIGNIWRKRRDPVQAKEAYTRAVALDPRRAKGYEALGDLYLEMSPMDSSLVDSALVVYEQGLEQDSTLVDLYSGIAQIYIIKGATAKADSVYQVALGLFPDDLSVQRLWGEFLYNQKRFAETVEALKPLVERFASDPNINKLREKLALAMAEVKMYKEAIAQLDKIVESDPTNVDALMVQGVILSRQKKYKDALKILKDALAKNPNLAMAHIYIADIEIERGNYGTARSHLKSALEVDPGLTVAYVYQGDIARRQGSEQIGGKALSSLDTDKLRAARSLYDAAKQYYQQGLGDRSYGGYCRSQINYLNQNIELIDKELFIR